MTDPTYMAAIWPPRKVCNTSAIPERTSGEQHIHYANASERLDTCEAIPYEPAFPVGKYWTRASLWRAHEIVRWSDTKLSSNHRITFT